MDEADLVQTAIEIRKMPEGRKRNLSLFLVKAWKTDLRHEDWDIFINKMKQIYFLTEEILNWALNYIETGGKNLANKNNNDNKKKSKR
jgi:hypothetical protein